MPVSYSLIQLLIFFLSIAASARTQCTDGPQHAVTFPLRCAVSEQSLMRFESRVIGGYGDIRKSEVSGHRHAGIDIRGNYNETVYAIGQGTVVAVFREFPKRTVIIRHTIGGNPIIYSVYIHLEDIMVSVGDHVDVKTPLGRLFNEKEEKTADFGVPTHLHLEIRHDVSDGGNATFTCMTMTELNRFCFDPLLFFRTHISNCKKGAEYEPR